MAMSEINMQNVKTLVLYFSWGGNTRIVANKIKTLLGADIVEIVPEMAYTLNYSECVAQARRETKEDFRPVVKTNVANLCNYDVIFVGTPNWCGTIAPPVATFLSQNKFDGKIIVPFVTHGGGAMARCETTMQNLIANASFLSGIAIQGETVASADEEIKNWLEKIGFLRK